ncbi:MAG: acyltransferase family protein, partial [Methylobacteriaceae bacterium]|nr:acyltransferase family protein [Methylobacteriaceae bacterium]
LLLAVGFSLSWLFSDIDTPSVAWLWSGAYSPLVYLGFLQNIMIGVDSVWRANFFAHTWSLAVEEQFYLVIPLLVVLTGRRALVAFTLAALVLGPVARMWIAADYSTIAAYCWPVSRMDAFAWGMAVALFAHARPDLLRRTPAGPLAAAAIALFVLFQAFAGWRVGEAPVAYALKFTFVDATAAMLVLAAAAAPAGAAIERAHVHRALAWMGERCFSLYLFHNACMGLAFLAASAIWPEGGVLPFLVAIAASWIAALAIGDLSYRRVELPFMAGGSGPLFARRQPATALG